MIRVGIATYRVFHLMRNAVITAFEVSSVKPDILTVMDSSNGGAEPFLADLLPKYPIEYLKLDNIGWPGSQNYMLRTSNYSDNIITCNDDIEFHDNTIEGLLKAADATGRDHLVYQPIFPGCEPWAVYLTTKWLVDIVGYFDEEFNPCYFDDNDMYRRMMLLGFQPYLVTEGSTYTHVGSATIHSSPSVLSAHHPKFDKNRNYYIRKWGGPPGAEVFTVPFNGG